MRVLHLSLYDRRGGACIAAYRQHVALRRHGVDSRMWVRFKVTNDPYVTAYQPPSRIAARVKRVLRRQLLRNARKQARLPGEFFDGRSEYGGDELRGLPECDVFNLQFSQDFVDHPAFYLQADPAVPVVVTLHEMSWLTGGCAYAGACTRYLEQCGRCPLLQRSGADDLSVRGWRRRQAAYAARGPGSLHFVADSHWLAGQARKSSLLQGYPVSVIHYGLDTEVFRPLDRSFARQVFHIPSHVPVVAFAAASVEDQRKGIGFLVEALGLLPEKPFLLTWGRNLPPALEAIPHLHLHNLESEHLMALAYNAADVFIMPSLEEAFGQTALEASACGTPVAAFAAGGIPDIVRHGKTGLLAPVGDAQALNCAINRLLADHSLRLRCSAQCRAMAQSEFSLTLNASRYQELYQSLLQTSRKLS